MVRDVTLFADDIRPKQPLRDAVDPNHIVPLVYHADVVVERAEDGGKFLLAAAQLAGSLIDQPLDACGSADDQEEIGGQQPRDNRDGGHHAPRVPGPAHQGTAGRRAAEDRPLTPGHVNGRAVVHAFETVGDEPAARLVRAFAGTCRMEVQKALVAAGRLVAQVRVDALSMQVRQAVFHHVGDLENTRDEALETAPAVLDGIGGHPLPVDRQEDPEAELPRLRLHERDSSRAGDFAAVARPLHRLQPCAVGGEVESQGRLVSLVRLDEVDGEVLPPPGRPFHVPPAVALGDVEVLKAVSPRGSFVLRALDMRNSLNPFDGLDSAMVVQQRLDELVEIMPSDDVGRAV